MGNIENYYENTKGAMAHKNVIDFVKIEDKVGSAIDIGCGAGRDTIFLIKNGWNVVAIDREDTEELIQSKLNTEELKRFKFECQNFENIVLKANDLVVSNFSIPFCSKNYFCEFWNKIVDSITSGRILCW